MDSRQQQRCLCGHVPRAPGHGSKMGFLRDQLREGLRTTCCGEARECSKEKCKRGLETGERKIFGSFCFFPFFSFPLLKSLKTTTDKQKPPPKEVGKNGNQKLSPEMVSSGGMGWSGAGAQLPSFRLACQRDAHPLGPPPHSAAHSPPPLSGSFAPEGSRSAATPGAFFSLQPLAWFGRRRPRLGRQESQFREDRHRAPPRLKNGCTSAGPCPQRVSPTTRRSPPP